MRTFQLLAIPLLGTVIFASPTQALSPRSTMEIITWSGNNCEGSSAIVGEPSAGVPYCAGIPGASWEFHSVVVGVACTVTTWSGNNCEGSSQVFHASDFAGCHAVPFGSVEISCN